MVAAFGAYFCMYGFRKPFGAGEYADLKDYLVASQVAGYAISKFIGIRVVSEMPRNRRAFAVLWLVLMAEFALILFAIVPPPWNAFCMFLNGLPLGMVFGMIMGLLEGRRLTEALTSALCASFILADGVTKSVGSYLLDPGKVSEAWMPATAGAVFLVPLAVFVAMLSMTPPPDVFDVESRFERSSMDHSQRYSFLARYFTGVMLIMLIFLCVTILRSLRADFAREIWNDLGVKTEPETFALSEIWVMLGVLIANGFVVLIRDHGRAFYSAMAVCGVGMATLFTAIVLQHNHLLSAFAFMTLVGLGLYLPYVAIHTTVFERWLAMTRDRGTTSFLMYIVDSIGYFGYIVFLVGRHLLVGPNSSSPLQSNATASSGMLTTLLVASWITVLLSTVCLAWSWFYFAHMAQRANLK